MATRKKTAKKKAYYNPKELNKSLEGLGENKYLKLKEGRNKFRILPRPDDSGLFFFELSQHFGFHDGERKRAYPCLKGMYNKPCPICEFHAALKDLDDSKAQKVAQDIRPTTAFLINVVDRASGKVKILSANMKMMRGIKAILSDEDYGYDVIDPIDGHDWTVDREGTGFKTRYSEPRVSPRPKPLDCPSWEEDLHDLEAEVDVLSYKQLAKEVKSNFGEYVSELELKFAGVGEDEDDDEYSEEDSEEEAQRKSKKGRKRTPVDDDEDEEESDQDDDEDDDEEDEESEEADDEDEDDDEFDIDDDDDEEEVVDEPKPKKKTDQKKKAKKRGKKARK